jgi:DNA polymerase-4
MNRLGIQTGADLKRQSPAFLTRHFGRSGSWYYAIARGQDDREVSSHRERKSSGSETTFYEDLVDPAAIEAKVQAMADDVWHWCEKTQCFGRTITVKIKYADFRQATRSRTLATPVASRELLHSVSRALVRLVLPPALGIRLVGVTMSGFEHHSMAEPAQLNFEL